MISNQDALSANKRALLKIRELKQQLAEKEDGAFEPIAIVSMACRFPKSASTPEKFWEQLISKQEVSAEVPASRWDPLAFFDEDPEVPGKMYTQQGVYLDGIDQMDPEFFGISPREATWVDPQQRLLMEVSWEAMERAGWIPREIGKNTGVFIGWMHNDYQNEASDSFLNLNPYIATGAAGSFLCGRLAYYLGLHGPALAVDTACSSSLVALHLGIQSLQRRECDQALVGGVNVICSPTTNILTCKLKALSPQGHSRAFDAAADGYLRGEGCGVVALRRLADARQAGDRILGVIRGSAIGHNGFSSGLTAPNPKAQEMVIRQALQRAQIQPNQVDYLEAHGTGTELGDPLEVQAAAAALCQDRSGENPLLIGSVKTNIGHLEAAAGMAGLIKVLLAFQNKKIPGQLNFENPNPHIPWDNMPIEVLTEAVEWPSPERPLAGVSAFGMSGTNAHVVLEGLVTPKDFTVGDSSPQRLSTNGSLAHESSSLLTVSARNEESLFELASEYAKRLESADEGELPVICRASQLTRSHFEHRVAIVATGKKQAIESLNKLVRGQRDGSTAMGLQEKRLKLAWQFTGQGSQYPAMAKQLYETESIFRAAIDQCQEWLSAYRDETLTDILFHDSQSIHDTLWTQPGLFAIQMGLAQLMNHWGIRPDVVLGHSVGQYAAACVAGVMTWQDGLKLISERGRLIASLPRVGRMLAVFAGREVVEQLVAGRPGVDVGAFNVSHVVISGQESAVAGIEEELADRGIRSRVLQTSHAFHSELMDPILDEFARFADQFEFHPSNIPLVCNQSGKELPADFSWSGRYWADHIRSAVSYQDSLQTVFESGCHALIELGPRPVLTAMAEAGRSGDRPQLISTLDEKTEDSTSLMMTVGTLYSLGVNPEFENLGMMIPRERVQQKNHELPTYPFQRRRFWGPDKPRAEHAEYHTAHPLLGNRLSLANAASEIRFENFVDTDSPSWMLDHQVMGSTVMPGAAFVELAWEASRQSGKTFELLDLKFEKPLSIDCRTSLQTVISDPAESGKSDNFLASYSQVDSESSWTRHFVVQSCREMKPGSGAAVDLEKLKAESGELVDVKEFYQFLESIDLNYGPRFRTIEQLYRSENGILARLVERGDLKGYSLSPPLLDGAFHSLAVAISREGDEMFLPVGMGKVRVYGDVKEEAWCHASWIQSEGALRTADLKLFDDQGNVVLEVDELMVQRIDRSIIRQATRSGARQMIYDFQWRRSRLAGKSLENKNFWMVFSSDVRSEITGPLLAELQTRGHGCCTIEFGDDSIALDTRQTETQTQNLTLEMQGDPDWSKVKKMLKTGENSETPDGIIWVFGEDGSIGPRSVSTESNTRGIVSLIQWLRKSGIRQLDSGFQLVTGNAVAIPEDSLQVNPGQTQYWGLGRVLSAECPEYRCRLVDLDCVGEKELSITTLADALLTDNDENQVVIRDREFLVPRISPVTTNQEKREWIRPESAYLISGGLGKLGRQAALWLAEQGARQVVLVSRRDPDEETREFLQKVQNLGTEIKIHPADLANSKDVDDLFRQFGREYLKLAGIIHAAGVLDDGLIDNQNWSRFEKVLRPKIDAAWNLHTASLTCQIDFFILYSSVASVLGSPGQANYAMGNGYLDGLAGYRFSQGLPALSLNWGPWTEGMADDEKIRKRLSLQGITPLEVKDAHSAMEKALSGQFRQCFVIDVDWRKLKLGADGKTPLILSELVTQSLKKRTGDSQLVAKLKKMAPAAQLEMLVGTVQKLFQEVIASETPPEVDRPLIEMGLDSLMAVEFGTSLAQAFDGQFEIGPSLLFDHPTIESIAEYLVSLVSEESTSGQTGATTNSESSRPASAKEGRTDGAGKSATRDDIAIIGLSCRFPGARGVDEYWSNLLEGVDSVGEIPDGRWDIERFYSPDREPGKMYSRQGGFLEDIGDFDPAFFNISESEACWIDPQHRMLLENSYHALEDAGIATKPLRDSNVGVFMGIMGQDYAFLPSLDDKEVIEGFEGAGLSHSAGVGRISYLLGLEGPSVAVDTASSSSLVAVIQAMRSLQEGNCNLALAGGVNAILAPVNSLLMSKAGLLSPDGRCKSFSEDADGFGRGEGCGVVVLKRLTDARENGDRILAVIRGGAIGHNGFSGGLTTPSSKAQVRVIESAIRDAGLSPRDIQYLEAHGTGTEFGDPIELAAAIQVYGKGRPKDQPLVVGSAKANIGHLEAAGGVSGLIKTVMALHRGEVPRQIHFNSPSKHIPWGRMPVTIPQETIRWEERKLEFAAVTALGLAGTNAHVILSAAPEQEVAKMDFMESAGVSRANQPLHTLFVSAKTDSSLTRLLHSYLGLLDRLSINENGREWPSLCYSSGVDRRHFEFRAAITASSAKEGHLKLEELLASRSNLSSNGASKKSGFSTRGIPERKLFLFTETEDFHIDRLEVLPALSPVVADLLVRFENRLVESGKSGGLGLSEFLQQRRETRGGGELVGFVFQLCLASLWKSWGLEPDVVAGMGGGQLAAACMADVVAPEDAFEILLQLDQVIDGSWDEFESSVDRFNFYPPNLALICSLDGQEVPIHRTLGGSYWREFFETDPGTEKIANHADLSKCNLVMNFGSRTGLISGFETEESNSPWIMNCSSGSGDLETALHKNLSELYAAGFTPDFEAFGNTSQLEKLALPVYPFEKKRYWITEISDYLTKSPNAQEARKTTNV